MLIMVGIVLIGVMLLLIVYVSDVDFCFYMVKDCCYDLDLIVYEYLFVIVFELCMMVLLFVEVLWLLV